MQPKIFFIVTVSTTIISTILQTCDAQGVSQYLLQYIDDDQCTPGNHSVNIIDPSSDQEQKLIAPEFGQYVYFKAMGFWKIFQYTSYDYPFYVYVDGNGEECQYMWQTYNHHWTATRLGDPLQIKREIQIFKDTNFDSTTYKFQRSTSSILPPMNVKSFFFSGNYSWGLFSEKNYKGVSNCFRSNTAGKEWGFTIYPDVNMTVGSILEGC
ncbi:uncharacterized protein LOC118439007 [Folsomia candida]|uniref:Transmembrane protein n=1 Tax=Folsomia candida TaxID=158441 RepID=A0A226D8U2_FOLCA|nr:uncharacterized protein LOC118439007 [Folsomia candida]OXA41553.1 hypothetical protein Fcan01_23697 [Folsomia candida]